MSQGEKLKISRRCFMKASALTLTASVAGSVNPVNSAGLQVKKEIVDSTVRSYRSFCGMCVNSCGLVARVKDGVVKRLEPMLDFPKSRGMLCARGQAGIQELYSPDRLKKPLLRKGKRGEGKWQELSWDEALDIAAHKLKEIGEKYTRCGWWFSVGADTQSRFVKRFAEVFGSYNLADHESLCFQSRNRGFMDTFGEVPFPDVANCKYLILAGANRFESLITPDSIDLMQAIKNGTRLIVLDPRRTKTAAMAHEWYSIRPGTDMAFVLALMHVITQERLYDPVKIKQTAFGLEQLTKHVKPYTPAWAEQECGIPAGKIARIARQLAAAAPQAMMYPGRRSSTYINSTETWRSFAILNGLLCNFDQPGGLVASNQPFRLKSGNSYTAPWYDDNPEDRADAEMAPLMMEDGAVLTLREVVLTGKPYPVKGLFTYHTNLLQTTPERRKTFAMLDKLDFFICVDIKMSDTAWMADLVLPSCSYLERQDPLQVLKSSLGPCVIQRDPVVSPRFESRPVFEMVKGMAERLDLGEFFNFTIEDYRKNQVAHLPGVKEILDKQAYYHVPQNPYGVYSNKSLKTLSGKVELYNQRYEKKGLPPIPVYTPPTSKKGMFRVVIGRNAYYTNTNTQDNPVLNEILSDNPLWIHPRPAQKLGIKDGDHIVVSSKVGEVKSRARLTKDVREDVVFMYSGFGNVSKMLTIVGNRGASVADILESHWDQITGNAALHETFVQVRKA